jgi:hypothetical protein
MSDDVKVTIVETPIRVSVVEEVIKVKVATMASLHALPIAEGSVLIVHLSDEVLDLISGGGLAISDLIEGDNIDITDNGNGTVTIATPDTHDTVSLVAGGTIPCDADVVFISGNGGAVTLTSTPTVAAGVQGQRLVLIGMSDINTVRVQNYTNLAGSTLHLRNNRDFIFGLNDSLELIYTGSAWVALGMSDNA